MDAVLDVPDDTASPLPRAPRRPEQTGLDFAFLVELLAKTLYVRGKSRLSELAGHSKLLPGVLEPVLGFMRAERLCETARPGETDAAATYSLTELGRTRAEDFLRRSRYAGPAPVGLQAYVEQVEAQSIAHMGVRREQLKRAFAGVILRESLVHQLGAAMNSGRAIFIYGPAGSGKSFAAEKLVGLLSGTVAVPHAFAADREVIQVFDPLVHEPLPQAPAMGLDRGSDHDARWVPCRRPVVKTGAELTLSMVELDFDEQTRFYHAPPQVKANNGLFILDDLGRQRVSAQDLMNRWIVPLDRRVDYLALHTGQKFMVPFDVVLVFSSNLRPSALADEAFLRRLGYKIHMGGLERDEYVAILRQVCADFAIPWEEEGLAHLLARHEAEARPLLACFPRDILGQLRDYAAFHGVRPRMTPSLLDWAWENYFPRD
jgi:DNA-binding PadR family transcriptional regulator